MDRTAWVAIIISVAGLFWWYNTQTQRQAERLRQQQEMAAAEQAAAPQQQAATATPAPAGLPAAQGTPGATSSAGAQAAPPVVPPSKPEVTLVASTPEIEAQFTSRGGGISLIKLLKHAAEGDGRVLLNQAGTMPIGAVTTSPELPALEDFTLSEINDGTSPAAGVLAEGHTANGLVLSKTFRIGPTDPAKDPYVFELEFSWKNDTAATVTWPLYFVATGEIQRIHGNDSPMYVGVDYFHQGNPTYTDTNWFNRQAIPLVGIETRQAQSVLRQDQAELDWVGVRNQFFASILTPRETKGSAVFGRRLDFSTPQTPHFYGIEGAIGMAGFSVAPGATHTQRFQLFTGPRELSRLKKLNNEEHQIIDYRIMGIGAFRWVSELLLHSLNGIKGLFANYATAIVILTIIIKLLLFPLQNKATREMKRMSLLSPKLTELREKYKDNSQKLNEEMMKLYRDYGMNPFAGCLPMFVQIPIFFGFYSMLGTAVELRNAGFLWIHDLSQPDTLFKIGTLPVNVLPLVMAASMLWQMIITPKTGDKTQQRMFMFMPVVFVAFCYNYASALALYWTVQNLFSIVQLYLTRNQPMPELKKVARAKNAREAFAAARSKVRR